MSNSKYLVQICGGQRCKLSFADDVFKAASRACNSENISVEKSGCMALCTMGPNLKVTDLESGESTFHHHVTEAEAKDIVERLSREV